MTHQPLPLWFWAAFPLYFVAIWLLATALISAFAGLPGLSRRFPDREEAPLHVYRPQIAKLNGLARLRGGALVLAACPGGLRISLVRIFAPFTRPAFVPWDQVAVVTQAAQATGLRLGGSVLLELPNQTAQRLMAHAPARG